MPTLSKTKPPPTVAIVGGGYTTGAPTTLASNSRPHPTGAGPPHLTGTAPVDPLQPHRSRLTTSSLLRWNPVAASATRCVLNLSATFMISPSAFSPSRRASAVASG